MTLVSLFAGIGGFDLGFARAGFKTVAWVEIDPQCRKLLAARFPEAAQFDDVRTVGAHNLPACGVLTFGFPCQDLSVAGKRAGLDGARSGLFYETTRIADELKPAFLVWENVPGLLSSNDGRDFLAVLVELDRIGYHGAWATVDAQFWGVAQRRRRVFGCFARGDIGAERCAEVLSLAEGVRWHPAPSREAGQRVAPTISAGPPFSRTGNERTEADALIAHTLRGEGFDASEDGTGRGTPLLVVQPILEAGARQGLRNSDRDGLGIGEPGDPMFTLQSSKQHAVAFNWQAGGSKAMIGFDETKNTTGALHAGQTPAVAFQTRIARNGRGQPKEITDALTSADGGTHADSKPHVAYAGGVRRLTPLECARLQGFPDDWLDGLGLADGPKYRMLGNAVAVPVATWIARRLAKELDRGAGA